jgi:hypothetical protein
LEIDNIDDGLLDKVNQGGHVSVSYETDAGLKNFDFESFDLDSFDLNNFEDTSWISTISSGAENAAPPLFPFDPYHIFSYDQRAWSGDGCLVEPITA